MKTTLSLVILAALIAAFYVIGHGSLRRSTVYTVAGCILAAAAYVGAYVYRFIT